MNRKLRKAQNERLLAYHENYVLPHLAPGQVWLVCYNIGEKTNFALVLLGRTPEGMESAYSVCRSHCRYTSFDPSNPFSVTLAEKYLWRLHPGLLADPKYFTDKLFEMRRGVPLQFHALSGFMKGWT